MIHSEVANLGGGGEGPLLALIRQRFSPLELAIPLSLACHLVSQARAVHSCNRCAQKGTQADAAQPIQQPSHKHPHPYPACTNCAQQPQRTLRAWYRILLDAFRFLRFSLYLLRACRKGGGVGVGG